MISVSGRVGAAASPTPPGQGHRTEALGVFPAVEARPVSIPNRHLAGFFYAPIGSGVAHSDGHLFAGG